MYEAPSEDVNGVYKATEERFRVVGYDRDSGWTGQTYGDALEFCAGKNSKIPCPYEAVCPMERMGDPVGGIVEDENGAWAPIMDSPNGWVQLGRHDPCARYTDVKPHPPAWGLTGRDNEKITRHVKCCDEVEGAGPKSQSKYVPEGGSGIKLTKTEEVVLDTMHPVWFGRKDGYHGTTHEDAELFCKTVGNMHLCPAMAYCPNGPHNSAPLFLQRDAFEGEQWAPVSEYENEDAAVGNDWILIGTMGDDPKNTCTQYEVLNNGRSPPWSADGSQNHLKEHVLCCMQQEGLKLEEDITRGMNPVWLDSNHGWNGGSYSDAEEFCEGLGGRKKLCPYAAYCPQGPGMNPTGEHPSDFNSQGEQWAPVYGRDNSWVLVGTKYGNVATTCYTHEQLEGGAPGWGLTGILEYDGIDMDLSVGCIA